MLEANVMTDSMNQSLSSEPNRSLASQEILHI